jgi:DNA-binding MarR family transcriptional regulator
MADVISPAAASAAQTAAGGERAAKTPETPSYYDVMGLLFFAYRDFVRDADDLLATYGFGRAHHRVLHFISRHPGLRVTELLDILKITKQSLGRVLRELIDTGYVSQEEGPVDRRQRLLFTTARGEQLAGELAALQGRRIAAAFRACGDGAHEQARAFLFAMIDNEERPGVARLIAGDRGNRPRRTDA